MAPDDVFVPHPVSTPMPERDAGASDDGLAYTEGEQLLALFKDNIEAIAIAIVMALVIKFFCVEAFQIPTGSMQPTLMGEHGGRPGDRILVDKWAYLLQDPARWDVPVFRYPLDESRNFIKRLVGLPGEEIRIGPFGDIWIRNAAKAQEERTDFEIARKHARARNQLFSPVYPPAELPRANRSLREDHRVGNPDSRLGPEHYWRRLNDERHAWSFPALGRFEFGGGEQAGFENIYTITKHTSPSSWYQVGASAQAVRDIRVMGTITWLAPPKGSPTPVQDSSFRLSWRPDDHFEADFVISNDPKHSTVHIRRDDVLVARKAINLRGGPGASYAFSFEYVDGDARLTIDETEIAVVPDGRAVDDAIDQNKQSLSVFAEGSALVLSNVRIHKDLVYGRDGAHAEEIRSGMVIPDDSYFMLGDNTDHSKDSRRWDITWRRLKDGAVIEYDDSERNFERKVDRNDPSIYWNVVTDRKGVERRWQSDEEEPGGRGERYAPFVRREHIVGRAFLKFWPLTPNFPNRLGFIH